MPERHHAPHESEPHPTDPTVTSYRHSRGYLPHRQAMRRTQMVTYRLADSLPRALLEKLLAEHAARPESDRDRDADYRRKLEALLDAGHGSSFLRHPAVAAEQVRIWKEDAPVRYELVAFVVMPTHVHLIVRLAEGQKLGAVVRRWKLRLNNAVRHLRDSGKHAGITPPYPLWHDEFFDRDIRDDTHLYAAANYIAQNPVKAGLCAEASQWPWSSAYRAEE